MPGDADIATTAALFADRRRCRILLALLDGRALAASTLASEAGVAASTTSQHLARLVAAGLISVERHGRHRYFRLAGGDVAELLEALARHSPAEPVRSLRQDTRAAALRRARTCYDHLAGRLGTAVMAALLERGLLEGGDGLFHPGAGSDRLSASGHDVDYRLTAAGAAELGRLGVDADGAGAGRRPPVRYCVDWSEQRHHLSGRLGAELARRVLELGWVRRAERGRALQITEAGRRGFLDALGVDTSALA